MRDGCVCVRHRQAVQAAEEEPGAVRDDRGRVEVQTQRGGAERVQPARGVFGAGGPEERADPFVWKCSESSRSPSSLWYEMRCLLNKDRWLWMLT